MMTYEEFVQAIRNYMEAPMSAGDTVLAAAFIIAGAAFAVWFALYLRRLYIKRKANTDMFDTSFAKDLKYPGFYPGGAPENDEGEEKKKPEKDKWGNINDEY